MNNEKAKAIAEDLDVSYPTVIRLNRELKEAEVNGTVDKFVELDEVILTEALEEAAANVPSAIQDEAKAVVGDIVKTKSAIDRFSDELIATAIALNMRIRSMSMSVDSAMELDTLVKSACNLQTAFFNKQTTQVNVQNNYGNDSKYGSFLSDTPQASEPPPHN